MPANGGLPVTETEIERDTGTGHFTALASMPTPNTTYEDTDVVSGGTYQYRIRVLNEQAASEYSYVSTFVAAGVPAQPDAVTLVDRTRSNITVSWTAPDDNGADIYQFVLRMDDGLGSPLSEVYRGASLDFSAAGLVQYRYYSFTVAAINAAGEGPESERVFFVTASLPSTVGQPILLESVCSTGYVKFKWTRPEDDGGCDLLQYRVLRDGQLMAGTEQPSTILEYFQDGLDCGTQYQWGVEVKNCLDEWSSTSPLLTTYTASLPEQVQGLNATHVSATELLFSWLPLTGTEIAGLDDDSLLTGYDLYVDDGIGGRFTKVYDGYNRPYETSFLATGLVPGRTYRAYVRATNVVGVSPDSDVIYKTMSVEPSSPNELVVVPASETSVTASWLPPDENGGEPIQYYVVEYAPEPLFDIWVEDGPYPDNTQFSTTIAGLLKGVVYQFRLRAVNGAGFGTYSNVVSHIVGTVPTSAPEDLGQAATTSNSMTWTWSPLDGLYTGGAPLIGYRLYMNTGRSDETSLVYDGADHPSITEFTATSLVCGRTYTAEVSALTRIGEGPRSSAASAVLATVPSQPRSARLLASSTASITIVWDVPENTGCALVESYLIERDSGDGFEELDVLTATAQAFTDDTGLDAGSLYIYRVSAKNVVLPDYGPPSTYITAFAARLPEMATSLGFVASTQTSITLQWDAPTELGGASRADYRVQKDLDDGLGGAFADAAVVSETFATLENLFPGRSYRFRVAVETVVGTGPYGPVFTQVVAALPGPPPVPTAETVSGYADRVNVSWAEPSDNGGSVILGYKVVFDGTCARYDGTSIASVTSVQLMCNTGDRHLITVQARNIIGWGPASPVASRVCGAEPGSPLGLGLLTAVPPRPIDMVDVRTPTSMTLTWSPPSDTGGVSIVSYLLYRDAGDSSGIYTLAYSGASTNVTIYSLTNGRTYRFYVAAVNEVGVGSQSSVLAADMKCAPRSLVSAPYRLSSTPWSVSLAWPETADDCGGTVSGYQLYRNGVLVFPISNSFVSEPTMAGPLTTAAVTFEMAVQTDGIAWIVVVEDDGFAGTPPLTSSAQKVKAAEGAVGRETCRVSAAAVTGGELESLMLYGCDFIAGQSYAAFVYVEGADAVDDDGYLFGPMEFVAPAPSNAFATAPRVHDGVNKDNLTVSFRATASSGKAYLMVVADSVKDLIAISHIREFTNAVGNGPCRWSGFVNTLDTVVELTECILYGGTTYAAFVYVEGGEDLEDGSLSEPLEVYVPYSNRFSYGPVVLGTPSESDVSLRFEATDASGLLWAMVVVESDAFTVNVSSIKAGTDSLCAVASQSLVSGVQTLTLSSCGLSAETRYKAFLYVEDAGQENDGELSDAIDVLVPVDSTTNTFSVYPQLVGSTTTDGVTLSFTATQSEGRLWATIVEAEEGSCMTVQGVKFLEGSMCNLWGENVSSDETNVTLSGCVLRGGVAYSALVYVEGIYNGDDGTLSPPVSFVAPLTNSFDVSLGVVADTVSSAGVELNFTASAGSGRAWAMIVSPTNAMWVTAAALKAGTYSVGGSTCRLVAAPINDTAETVSLTGCSMYRGVTYKAFVYVDGASTIYNDGMLSAPIDVPVAPTSLGFQVDPQLTRTPTTDTVELLFVAKATDLSPSAEVNGTFWVQVVPTTEMAYATPESMKSGAGAMGGSGCRLADQNVTTLQTVSVTLSGCLLKYSTSYQAAVYVEDELGKNDGALYFLEVEMPPGVSNAFLELPAAENATTDNVSVVFTATQAYGKAWISVADSSLASLISSPSAIMSGLYSVGGSSCRAEAVNIDSPLAQTIDLGCSLEHSKTYAALVLVSDMGGHGDGDFSTAFFTTPPSNEFKSGPTLSGTPSTDAVTVTFEATEPLGYVWAAVVLSSNEDSVTLSTIKYIQMYAMGDSSCRVAGLPISTSQETLALTGCYLTNSEAYKLFVYVEDAAGQGDGTLVGLDVAVPGSSVFTTEPSVYGDATSASVALSFAASQPGVGAAWAAVGDTAGIAAMDAYDIKIGQGAICMVADQPIGTGTEFLTITGCGLELGASYSARVYVEYSGLPGTLSEPFDVEPYTSNGFSEAPTVSSGPTQSDVELTFSTLVAGEAWGVIVDEANAPNVTGYNIKLASSGLIAGTFCYANMSVSSTALQTMPFTGCDFVMNAAHKAFIYVEDAAGAIEGTLSSFVNVILQASNSFSVDPYENMTATLDGPFIDYAVAGSGKVWVSVVAHTGDVTAAEVKAGTLAIGGTCGSAGLDATASPPSLTGCGFVAGQTYTAHFYVEDDGARDDGTLYSVPIKVPLSTASNLFAASPRLDSALSGNGFNLTFQPTVMGVAYALVVSEGTPVSASTVMSGIGALGDAACGQPGTVLSVTNETTNVLTFSDCGFAGGVTYLAYVYVATESNSSDGVLSNAVPLAVPVSNDFTPEGPKVEAIDGSKVGVLFTATVAGRAWLAVWPSSVALTLAMGSDTTGSECNVTAAAITAGESNFTVSGCRLLGGATYSIAVYVDDGLGNGDGNLTVVSNVLVPVTNAISMQPELSASVLSSEIRVTLSTLTEGTGWAKVVKGSAPPFTDVVSLLDAGDNVACDTGTLALSNGSQLLSISGCALSHDTDYTVYAYVAGPAGYTDGTLSSGLLAVVVPGRSNMFTVVPEITGPVTADNVTLTFSAALVGRVWAMAVPSSQVQGVGVAEILAGSAAACSVQEDAAAGGENTVVLAGCGFRADLSYAALVYLTNDGAGSDGVLSAPLPLIVQTSNSFEQAPALAAAPTRAAVAARLVAALDGQAWLAVLNASDVASVAGVKTGAGAACQDGPVSVAAGDIVSVTVACNLDTLEPYSLYVYVEGPDGALGSDDGQLSSPVDVLVPPSNGFLAQPEVSAISADGLTLAYSSASDDGKAWVVVMNASDAALGSVDTLLDPTGVGVGGSSCMLANESIARGETSLNLTGCAFRQGSDYVLLVYVEDAAGGEGTLSAPVHFSVPASNSFETLPYLTSTPTQDGVSFSLVASAAIGRLWAQLLTEADAQGATAAFVKGESGALGLMTCRESAVTISTSILQYALTQCILPTNETYVLAVYIEDIYGNDDGSLHKLDVLLPASVSNYFTESPVVLGDASTDGAQVAFTAFASMGYAWAVMLGSASPVGSITDIKRATGSLGASGCKFAEVYVDNARLSLEFSGCSLAHGNTYVVVVYVEDHLGNGDGVYDTVSFSVPNDTVDYADPMLRNYTDYGVTVGLDYYYHVRA
ncbi:unnamed protein product, partial [Prorocentrum cordatum]